VRLYEFSQAVNGSPNADLVLRHVLEQVKDVAKADSAELLLVGSGSDLGRHAADSALLTRVSLDLAGRFAREEVAATSLPDVLRETVLRRGQPYLVRRGSRDGVARALVAAGTRDAVWAPLRGDAGVLGCIGVSNRQGEVRGFDREDQLLLETVAAHTAIALQKGRLIDQLRFEATHDVLTGLPNRALLNSATVQAINDLVDGSGSA
jgi:GAF domain-containing protein